MITDNQTKIVYFQASTILKFLIGEDEMIDTIIMCNPEKIELRAFDNEVYEALASIKNQDEFKMNKLKKFFEVVDIYSYKTRNGKDKPILTEEKLSKIREQSLRR